LIWDPTIPKIWQARNPIVGNMDSCFCHHCKWHFISFTSIWYCLKMINSLFTSFFTSSFVLVVCSNISKLQSSSTPMLTKTLSNYTKRCKWWWHFNNMGYKDLLSYSSTIETPYSLPINEDTRWRLLSLGFNIKENIFFSNFFKKEKKDSNARQTSFLNVRCKRS